MNEETYRAVQSAIKFGDTPSSEVLRATIAVLQDNHWLRGTTAVSYRGDDKRRYDLIGALIASTGFQIHEPNVEPDAGRTTMYLGNRSSYYQKRNNYELWSRTVTRRGKKGYLRCLDYVVEVTGYDDIEQWNDEIAEDKDHVIEVLLSAADLAEKRGD